MHIALISKPGHEHSGVGRYTAQLRGALEALGHTITIIHPMIPLPNVLVRGMRKGLGWDLQTFFENYPVRARYPIADIYHFTSQSLASLLVFQKIHPIVVTVHDIIPYLLRSQPELATRRRLSDNLFFDLALRGLRYADVIITDSKYTRATLIDSLNLSPEKIHVVYIPVDPQVFKPMLVEDEFLAYYGLSRQYQYIFYVGSEDPRKNISTLVEAFACVRAEIPNTRLLMAGAEIHDIDHQKLLMLIEKLGLQNEVVFLQNIPDEDLVRLYNLASVLVLPSFFEGYGLPALEAMSCGRPVVVANSSSLPEIVGKDGLLFDPRRPEHLVAHLCKILKNEEARLAIANYGLERSKLFSMEKQTSALTNIYSSL